MAGNWLDFFFAFSMNFNLALSFSCPAQRRLKVVKLTSLTSIECEDRKNRREPHSLERAKVDKRGPTTIYILSLDSSNFPYVCFCGLKSSDFRFLTDKVTRVRRIFFLLYLTSNHILIFIHKLVGSHSTSFWILMEFEKRFHNWLSELFHTCTKLHENHENDYY